MSSKFGNQCGKTQKIYIRNELINPDIEFSVPNSIFSCIGPKYAYASLQSIVVKYTPVITERSTGSIGISVSDRRFSASEVVSNISLDTSSKANLMISGFSCCPLEEGCPYTITISTKLEGVNYGAAVGSLVVSPSFRLSNEPIPTTGITYQMIKLGDVQKTYQGVAITDEKK
ncbi:3 protein [Cacao swollen shoot Togo A virus]|uniref:Protein 3 n=2 Tax=Riboviria TaxID=2559587 RepID=VP3_NCMV|nr:unnamed protein product; gene 3 protein [Cytorhabdovirus gramineae]YP_009506255.1 3 protein [Cacao swollen shoot Togo A virus]Q9JGT9.1 RecName: Full=Protein 3 [Cytorhabdovirus gramineae]ADE61671.1 3 protein [Cacao swollen shoot Togo A virus]BAA95346.1 3 [Cytorhabdovirus gramineae] [Cytorhabdovirus gramineae]